MRKSVLTTLAVCAAIVGPSRSRPPHPPRTSQPTSRSGSSTDTGPDIFRGRVSSPNANCIGNRNVRLFRARPGDDRLIDTDSSEDNGSWSIDVEGDPAPGRYYVNVTRRALGADSCAPARSPVIDVAG